MLGMLEHSPDLYVDEIQDQLAVVHGLELSLATINRTLKRLGMTTKKVSLPHRIKGWLTIVSSFLSLQLNGVKKHVGNLHLRSESIRQSIL